MDRKQMRQNNVLEYIENAARRYPENTAFQDDRVKITYAELQQQVRKIGYQISAKGVGVRHPIVVFMDKCVECLVSFFGVVASGNFYVCIDMQMPPERIHRILENLHPAAVLGKGIEGNKTFGGCLALEFEELLSGDTGEEEVAVCLQGIRRNMIDADPLYLLYTSGSTGTPKGSVISHRSVIDYAEWVSQTFQFDNTAVLGSQTPFYFSMSVLDIYTAVRNGAALQIIPKKLFSFPIKLLEYLREKEVNAIYWVPSALSIVADWSALDYVEVPGLRTVLFAGEAMPTRQLNIWRSHLPDATYANLFGPTEITDIGMYYIIDRDFSDDEPIPIGHPCENMDAFAIAEGGKQIGEGEIGELYFRGSFVGHGYYNSTGQTEEAFVQNPLNQSYKETVYRTGDLVKINKYGEYVYVGRKDSQIKHMGYRIELGEIESVMYAFEKLERVVCLFHPERDYIILLYQGSAGKDEVLSYAKDRLPSYMLPDEIVSLRTLPLNANGKVDRKRLKETYLEVKKWERPEKTFC